MVESLEIVNMCVDLSALVFLPHATALVSIDGT